MQHEQVQQFKFFGRQFNFALALYTSRASRSMTNHHKPAFGLRLSLPSLRRNNARARKQFLNATASPNNHRPQIQSLDPVGNLVFAVSIKIGTLLPDSRIRLHTSQPSSCGIIVKMTRSGSLPFLPSLPCRCRPHFITVKRETPPCNDVIFHHR